MVILGHFYTNDDGVVSEGLHSQSKHNFYGCIISLM